MGEERPRPDYWELFLRLGRLDDAGRDAVERAMAEQEQRLEVEEAYRRAREALARVPNPDLGVLARNTVPIDVSAEFRAAVPRFTTLSLMYIDDDLSASLGGRDAVQLLSEEALRLPHDMLWLTLMHDVVDLPTLGTALLDALAELGGSGLGLNEIETLYNQYRWLNRTACHVELLLCLRARGLPTELLHIVVHDGLLCLI